MRKLFVQNLKYLVKYAQNATEIILQQEPISFIKLIIALAVLEQKKRKQMGSVTWDMGQGWQLGCPNFFLILQIFWVRAAK